MKPVGWLFSSELTSNVILAGVFGVVVGLIVIALVPSIGLSFSSDVVRGDIIFLLAMYGVGTLLAIIFLFVRRFLK